MARPSATSGGVAAAFTEGRRGFAHHGPFGAQLTADGAWFRLWAPNGDVALRLGDGDAGRDVPMERDRGGWLSAFVPDARAGTRYGFRLADGMIVPDPASRRQPNDVHGLSELVDPFAYRWRTRDWRGRPWREVVLYELHVGSFTPSGTFEGVAEKLPYLRDLGITAVELMPVADFPGRRNWGYDGALPYAPDASYGGPDDLKRLIDDAHDLGLMMFLDVVYNHFGPDGNYLHLYAKDAFTDRFATPWGAAIDFSRRPVRDFFIHNAVYWLEEFRFDGLRLDAVHAIRDDSRPDILEELAQVVRARIDPRRHVHLVLENDDNRAGYLRRDVEGRPQAYVAQWNDDIHHALHVVATDEDVGYYRDYAEDGISNLGRCLASGFAYQGQESRHRGGARRGESSGHLPPSAFVSFLQNHDQVGNRAFGDRLVTLASAPAIEALTAILLLAPQIPMLFMGEEWGCRQPFAFFCDFEGELADNIRDGRRREFGDRPEFASEQLREQIPDPLAEATFRASILDWTEASTPQSARMLAHRRRLLATRRREIVPLIDRIAAGGEYARFGASGLVARWRIDHRRAALVLSANLGPAPLTDAPPPPRGRVIYDNAAAPAGLGGGATPAWSVVWTIEGELSDD